MSEKIKTVWKGNMAFEWEVNGHKVMIDATDKVGGENRGPRPKPFMLAALGGCTGMDVVSILKKMRVTDMLSDFNVEVSGELTDEHPKHFISMHVAYIFTPKDGEELPTAKLEKAINLSEERYCGVSEVYKKAGIKMTSEIIINKNNF
ncbi:MAG: OsmC family protein [Bacteroidales bacterium]|nr:OsmC family protein [Bacteroidales bacterium]